VVEFCDTWKASLPAFKANNEKTSKLLTRFQTLFIQNSPKAAIERNISEQRTHFAGIDLENNHLLRSKSYLSFYDGSYTVSTQRDGVTVEVNTLLFALEKGFIELVSVLFYFCCE
jgi:hypothetical protein